MVSLTSRMVTLVTCSIALVAAFPLPLVIADGGGGGGGGGGSDGGATYGGMDQRSTSPSWP